MCFSHCERFSIFIAIFQIQQCVFFFFHRFSPYSIIYSVCVSHFPRFSFFSPYSRSYTVHFPFSILMSGSPHISGQQCLCTIFNFFFRFLPTLHVLPGDFLMSWVSQFFCHIPGPTVCISHFSHSIVLAIFYVPPCVCLISTFFIFLPIIQTYSAHF